jgi:ABC-type nitrate/sulfonate/bicarbonate transport system substrate-binding protein
VLTRRKLQIILAGATALALCTTAASAETTLRVGKAMAPAFNFAPLNVGMATGIFKKHGVVIDEYDFGGSARLQQALAAGSIDIGLGSGPEFAAVIKGSPIVAVGELAGKPSLLVIVLAEDTSIKTMADLKGKKISVSTAGSSTQWLVRELSRRQGWGPTGIEAPPLGADPTMIAAMKTKQVDGLVTDVATGYQLEANHEGHVFVKFGDVIDHLVFQVIWGHKTLIANNPQAVKDFLAAWYETIHFMQDNKQKTVEIAAPVMNVTPEIASRAYDELMPAMSADGKFDPQGLDTLEASFPELGLLDQKPDLTPYLTEQYLPK